MKEKISQPQGVSGGFEKTIRFSLWMFIFTCSFSIFLSNFFLYLSLTLYAVQYITRRKPFHFDRIYTIMLLFAAVNILSLFTAGKTLGDINKVKNVMSFLAFMIAFEKAGLIKDRFKMMFIMQATNAFLLAGAILINAAGLSDYYLFCDFANWTNQYSGLFSISLTYAGFLVMMQCVSLALLSGGAVPEGQGRAVFTGLMAVNMLGLVFTYARGAWLAMLVMAFFIISFRLSRRAIAGFLAISALALAFIVSPLGENTPFINDINRRIKLTVSGDSSGREIIYRVGLKMIMDRPITGLGIGGVEKNYPEYIEKADFLPQIRKNIILGQKVVYGHLHNVYMQIWAECGIIGIISFLWLLFYSLSGLWARAFKTAETDAGSSIAERCFAAGVFAALVSMCLMGVTEYNFFHNEVGRILWFYVGLAFAPPAGDQNQHLV